MANDLSSFKETLNTAINTAINAATRDQVAEQIKQALITYFSKCNKYIKTNQLEVQSDERYEPWIIRIFGYLDLFPINDIWVISKKLQTQSTPTNNDLKTLLITIDLLKNIRSEFDTASEINIEWHDFLQAYLEGYMIAKLDAPMGILDKETPICDEDFLKRLTSKNSSKLLENDSTGTTLFIIKYLVSISWRFGQTSSPYLLSSESLSNEIYEKIMSEYSSRLLALNTKEKGNEVVNDLLPGNITSAAMNGETQTRLKRLMLNVPNDGDASYVPNLVRQNSSLKADMVKYTSKIKDFWLKTLVGSSLKKGANTALSTELDRSQAYFSFFSSRRHLSTQTDDIKKRLSDSIEDKKFLDKHLTLRHDIVTGKRA